MALYIPHSIFHLARLLYVRPETYWALLRTNAGEVTSHDIASGLHLGDVLLASRSRQINTLLLSSLHTDKYRHTLNYATNSAANTLCRHNSEFIDIQESMLRGVSASSQNELSVNTLRYMQTTQGSVLCFCETGPLNKAI